MAKTTIPMPLLQASYVLMAHSQSMPKEETLGIVMEMYDAHKEVKEYLEFYANPDEDDKLEDLTPWSDKKVKTIIKNHRILCQKWQLAAKKWHL